MLPKLFNSGEHNTATEILVQAIMRVSSNADREKMLKYPELDRNIANSIAIRFGDVPRSSGGGQLHSWLKDMWLDIRTLVYWPQVFRVEK